VTDSPVSYAARLNVDYPEKLSRLTTFFRPIMMIPIAIVLGLVSSGLAGATGLMIVFRRRYPRWWFDFARELTRFSMRVGAYAILLTDRYPSTVDEQSVHVELDYPDAERDLSRWLPLVKWFLAVPHYIVLFVLAIVALLALIVAWFAILFTGRYPRPIFDYVVGLMRWGLRVNAYVALLVTDRYPPFNLV
jgi:Domain of unknown function (DUF4389)